MRSQARLKEPLAPAEHPTMHPLIPGNFVQLPCGGPRYCPLPLGKFVGDVTQVTAIEPFGLEYINSKDDPENKTTSVKLALDEFLTSWSRAALQHLKGRILQ
jgi:hypothetical protein